MIGISCESNTLLSLFGSNFLRCVPNSPQDIQVRYNLSEPKLPQLTNVHTKMENENTRGVYSQILQNEFWGSTIVKERNNNAPSLEGTSMFTYTQKTTPVDTTIGSFSSPMGLRSQQILASPKKPVRKIPSSPFKVQG
jgi:cell division cycle 20-like protein 1 (cofactor of APC complex)